MKIGPRKIG